MTDRARRTAAATGGLLIALLLVVRVQACGAAARGPSAHESRGAATRAAATALTASVGEGAERPTTKGAGAVAESIWSAASHALLAYRALERRPRSSRARSGIARRFTVAASRTLLARSPRPTRVGRLPALRHLVVTSAGPGRWRATALTRSGELYLVIDLARSGRGVIATGVR